MENNYDIFKYLEPLENTKISNFHGYDLSDLAGNINKYYLEYRNKLNINSKPTIGFEIEFENKEGSKLIPVADEDLEIKPGWNLREDGTLKNGGEIVSPVLYNNHSSWKDFYKVFQLFDGKQEITDTCSSHVHIGVQMLGSEPLHWNNFLKLWSVYENVIYRFCFGEYLNPRLYMSKYAIPIAKKIESIYKELENEYGAFFNPHRIQPLKEYCFRKHLKNSRYYAVNFSNVGKLFTFANLNTLEFRVGNGSLNPIVLQNYANLYLSLLEYAKNHSFDLDTIEKRREKLIAFGRLDYYNELNFEEALELCDLIFDKNIDKIYFLRQYLKDNDVTNHMGLVKAKKFTI